MKGYRWWLRVACLGLALLVYASLVGAGEIPWEAVGLSGGGGMFAPAISAADPNLMWITAI